jgi:hypothetical protein
MFNEGDWIVGRNFDGFRRTPMPIFELADIERPLADDQSVRNA